MPTEIVIRPYQSINDLNRYQSIFKNNSDSIKSIDFLNWMHINNPNHLPLMQFAISNDSDSTAALYAVFAVKFKYSNSTQTACQSIDTITDINFRGKGLFIQLAKAQFEECIQKQISFVYGFPNQNSVHGFITKLGWKEIAEVPFIIRPIKWNYFLNRLIKNNKIQKIIPSFSAYFKRKIKLQSGWTIQQIDKFDSQFDSLWSKYSEGIKVGIERNAEYLNWRLIQKPNESYINKALFNEKGELVAFISYCVKQKHQGHIGYILEFIYDDNFSNDAQSLFNYALNDMKSLHADLVLAWSFPHSKNYGHYKKAGFYYLANRFRPIKLFFGVKDLLGNNSALFHKENWYISYCDSDTV